MACRGYQKKSAGNHMACFGMQKEMLLLQAFGCRARIQNTSVKCYPWNKQAAYYLQGGRGSIKTI